MRTIKQLINPEKKVYIRLRGKAIRYRFMSDAEREGITYGDKVKPTESYGFTCRWNNIFSRFCRTNGLSFRSK